MSRFPGDKYLYSCIHLNYKSSPILAIGLSDTWFASRRIAKNLSKTYIPKNVILHDDLSVSWTEEIITEERINGELNQIDFHYRYIKAMPTKTLR